jgi:glutamine amidotransferase
MEAGIGMKLPVTLFDYGVGNIHSLKKAVDAAGAEVSVEEDPDRILNARVLLLPGVGAFSKVAESIAPVREAILQKLEEGLPALGVCIGMHLLHETSEEGGGSGIGLLRGRIRKLRHQRLPHIGWNQVHHGGEGLFQGISPAAFFYFVHSFAPSGCGEGCVATGDYGDRFAAATTWKNTWGVQFHPEKSSEAGQLFLRNFVAFAGERT